MYLAITPKESPGAWVEYGFSTASDVFQPAALNILSN
jgi:hypothetical protein